MKFLSIYQTQERNTPPTQEEMDRMGKLIEEGFKSGKLVATEGCLPSKLGARIRQANGQASVTDGPFTEAKDLLSGYILIGAKDLNQATQIALECPIYEYDGSVEVRPVRAMEK
jgi:hypothetical protein